MDKLKRILKEAFEAGEEYAKEKGVCEYEENFEEWYAQQQVKNTVDLADISWRSVLLNFTI